MMVVSPGPIVVAGAGLAAFRTVRQLRQRGYRGPVVMLSGERHAPYDRPPLSKAVLHGRRDSTSLPFDAGALEIDLRLGQPARRLDLARRVVVTDDAEIAFSQLVIATGADPVRLPGDGPQLTLRTIDDALALREQLQPGAQVVIIGASWIGAEVATAALARGSQVTCLESGAAPLAGALGPEVGSGFLPWWGDVDLRLGTQVAAVRPGQVELADGSTVPADTVVTGVGVRPSTGWLAGGGIELDGGVLVDDHLRTSAPGVVALGDVAKRWSSRSQARLRLEHWTEAGSGGPAAADTLLADDPDTLPPYDPVPYFWSDQFGHRVEYVGHHDSSDTVGFEDDLDKGWVARWTDSTGHLTAALAVDQSKLIAATRAEIATGPSLYAT